MKKLLKNLIFVLSILVIPSISKASNEYKTRVNIPIESIFPDGVESSHQIRVKSKNDNFIYDELFSVSNKLNKILIGIEFNTPGIYEFDIYQENTRDEKIEYTDLIYKATVFVENDVDIEKEYTGRLTSTILLNTEEDSQKKALALFVNKISSDSKDLLDKGKTYYPSNPYTGDSFSVKLYIIYIIISLLLLYILRKRRNIDKKPTI